jgi:acyl-CoA thioester hydrolase
MDCCRRPVQTKVRPTGAIAVIPCARVLKGGNLNVYNDDGATKAPEFSETMVRVNYSETDQMGVVYHARYLVWLDIARCDYLRQNGMTYRDLENQGLRLAVSEMSIKYRQPARYDDLVRVLCWVRSVASRRVEFGYLVEDADDRRLLATATTSLLALDTAMSLTRLPAAVREKLHPVTDPVKLGT